MKKFFLKIFESFKKLIQFILTDIWTIPVKELHGYKKPLIKTLKVILIAIKGFEEDKLQLKASGLTFYSLLSIVPALAMAFGIAKGFGLETVLEEQLRQSFEGQKEVLEQGIDFANSYLKSTKGGFIAGIGVVMLFWTIIKLLMNIEEAFNEIWKVEARRNYTRRFTDYFALLLIAPVLMVLSSSITVFIVQSIKDITQAIEILHYVSWLILGAIKLIPYLIVWLMLTLFYRILPNTRVNIWAALSAGIFAGTIYQVTQWAYIHFQVGVSKYNAIYGSFAALPLFLIWLQLSWLIILIGAKLSYAVQNTGRYEYTSDLTKISMAFNKTLTLYVCRKIVKNFAEAKPALSLEQISEELDIPRHIASYVLEQLIQCNIICEVKNPNDSNEPLFHPAQDIARLNVKYIIDTIEHKGINEIRIAQTDELSNIKQILNTFENNVEKSSENKLIRDL